MKREERTIEGIYVFMCLLTSTLVSIHAKIQVQMFKV